MNVLLLQRFNKSLSHILCRELTELYTFGVRNFIALTNQGMGRKPDVLRVLTSATGINIIPSTGYYLEAYMPPEVRTHTAEELTADKLPISFHS